MTLLATGQIWSWDYDYRDRRVREYLNNVPTKLFIWSDQEIVQERTAAGAITRTHYFGGFSDGPNPTTGTKYQTLPDHLGHIRDVLGTGGTLSARYDYTPYQGPVKVGTSTVDPTFLTIGRYCRHTGSGLELALYRAYDPELGRWLSRDPLEDAELLADGPNLFAYAANSPQNLKDLDGTSAVVAVGVAFGCDVAVPDPSDIAWPKWAGWAVVGIGAAIADCFARRQSTCTVRCQVVRIGADNDVIGWTEATASGPTRQAACAAAERAARNSTVPGTRTRHCFPR